MYAERTGVIGNVSQGDDMIIVVDKTNVSEAAKIHSISWKESHRSFCTTEFIDQHSPQRQEAYLRWKMENGSKFYMLVEKMPIGIVSITENLIEDLYVLPEMQNHGFGSQLLKYAIDQCAGTPTLWILENNVDAARLYRRIGFEATGKRKVVAQGLDEMEYSLRR